MWVAARCVSGTCCLDLECYPLTLSLQALSLATAQVLDKLCNLGLSRSCSLQQLCLMLQYVPEFFEVKHSQSFEVKQSQRQREGIPPCLLLCLRTPKGAKKRIRDYLSVLSHSKDNYTALALHVVTAIATAIVPYIWHAHYKCMSVPVCCNAA